MENCPSSFNWLRSDHLLFFTIATCRGKIVKFGWKFLQPQASHVPHLESSGWTQIHPKVNFRPMWLALSPRVGLRLWVGENEKWLQLRESPLFKFKEHPPYPTLSCRGNSHRIFILDCVVVRYFQTFGFKLFFKNHLVHDNIDMQKSSKLHHSNTSNLKECLS